MKSNLLLRNFLQDLAPNWASARKRQVDHGVMTNTVYITHLKVEA